MSFNFFDNKKTNKAQWHFGKEHQNGYELNDEEIHTDVLGSYTGTAYDDPYPVQDADDL